VTTVATVAAVDPDRALAGRREAELLELPSVRRMAEILALRFRGPSWVRNLVAGLDRARLLTLQPDLEGLLAAARADPALAERWLAALAHALDGQPDVAVAGLAMGPKVWLRLGGVPVPWRPLPASAAARRLPAAGAGATDPAGRIVLLAMIGSGLHLAELLRLRVGDLGSLDHDGELLPDPRAEPLAARYQQRRGGAGAGERLTFLPYLAREAIGDDLERRRSAGLDTGPRAPLVAGPDGGPAPRATIARARRQANAIIGTASALNVELCRKTGEFFRDWGLPGARFYPSGGPAATMGSARGPSGRGTVPPEPPEPTPHDPDDGGGERI